MMRRQQAEKGQVRGACTIFEKLVEAPLFEESCRSALAKNQVIGDSFAVRPKRHSNHDIRRCVLVGSDQVEKRVVELLREAQG